MEMIFCDFFFFLMAMLQKRSFIDSVRKILCQKGDKDKEQTENLATKQNEEEKKEVD